MTDIRIWRRVVAMGAVLLLGAAGAVFAQAPTGNLYGTVTDTEGARLPGVSVTLSGIGAPRVQVTDERGNFRFLGLDPGAYSMRAELEGFSTVEQANINIRVARSTEIQVELSAAVEEVITVTSESPLLDDRKLMTGTSVSQIELEKIPTARDPWAILNQTPGVLVDRINVGGNQSGQQSVFVGQGISDDENAFLVDGIETTDMRAIGASSTYYDFDQFTEIQMSTGGTDVTKNSAGVGVNLVTKRGTNEFRGSARFYVTDGGGQLSIFDQSDPDIDPGDLADGTAGTPQTTFTGNQINRIEDFGIEFGGPLVRDRVWLWGSWAENDIKNFVAGAAPGSLLSDDTILENTSIKLNTQFTGANSAVASWNNGDKSKFGRNASPTRPTETTWNQRGPSAIWKVEDTHVFGSNFFLTGTWSHLDFGFALAARGGAGDSAARSWQDGAGVWHDGFLGGGASSPEDQYRFDASYFFNTGEATSHEIKFGGRFRDYETASVFSWPGGEIFSLAIPGFPLVVTRRGLDGPPINQEYTGLWVQDTISSGRFTYNVGLRYDLQEGKNLPVSEIQNHSSLGQDNVVGNGIRANPWAPDVQPGLEFNGADAAFEWEDIQPRVGITYALGEERNTLLRASFSQFAEQLQASDINRLNPANYSYAYFLNLTDYLADPNDPNNRFDEGDELLFLETAGVDPANPNRSPNITDPNLDAQLTSEVVLGVEHAFLPEFVVGLNFTLRETDDIKEFRDLVRPEGTDGFGVPATVDDYVPSTLLTGTLPDGSPYSVQTFALNPALEFTGGSFLTNGDRSIEYQGIGLTLTKRLANRWMARGNFQYGEGEWDVPASFLRFDDPNPEEIGTDIDSGLFAIQSAGSGAFADTVIQSTWSANVNGMYQIAPDRPWGFNVAANLYAREGYVAPPFRRSPGGDGRTRDIRLTDEIDDFRFDDIFTTDLSINKDIRTGGDLGVTLSIDLFNAFNENYVLQRNRRMGITQSDWLRETLSPRIWRLGARLSWR
ncbi:MAG: carboxypeptidase regulatory-like domain-containing protein [Thermoanaerobaculia bacterium]